MQFLRGSVLIHEKAGSKRLIHKLLVLIKGMGTKQGLKNWKLKDLKTRQSGSVQLCRKWHALYLSSIVLSNNVFCLAMFETLVLGS